MVSHASITSLIEFDYGHRILGHKGKCRYLHGHRGRAEITVQAPELDSLGMVIDFKAVKELVGGWIQENWDHNLLLNVLDPQLHHLIQTEERPPYTFSGNPTAENMAKELFQKCKVVLPASLQILNIRLYETSSCWADYAGEI